MREFGRTVIGVGVRSNTSNYLAKSCDTFCYYDDLRSQEGDPLPERSVSSTPMNTAALLTLALAQQGNRPLPGSALKMHMRKIDPMFDETRQGHNSFLEFLRAHTNVIDLHKPAVGDVTVAPKGTLFGPETAGEVPPAAPSPTAAPLAGAKFNHPGYTPYVPSNGIPYQAPPPPPPAPPTAAERYDQWLRDNNFRHVPPADRHEIIRAVYTVFVEAEDNGEEISLKEGKDRLHQWFEANRPSVPWESINSTVYHLFYTWCFNFDRSDENENKQLWDRRTALHPDIHSDDELISRSERGIIRKLWERDRLELDIDGLNDWLFDNDPAHREYVADLVRTVASAPSGYAAIRPMG